MYNFSSLTYYLSIPTSLANIYEKKIVYKVDVIYFCLPSDTVIFAKILCVIFKITNTVNKNMENYFHWLSNLHICSIDMFLLLNLYTHLRTRNQHIFIIQIIQSLFKYMKYLADNGSNIL